MSRRKMLWVLIILSAASATTLYVMQGILATGKSPEAFGPTFLLVDTLLWGLRALVEAAVIIYVFETRTSNKVQSIMLAIVQVLLISTITLTLAPALRAIGLGIPIRESLSENWFTAWNFGIAAYTSLMMGAAGLAYRCQPFDEAPAPGTPQAEVDRQGIQTRLAIWLQEAQARITQVWAKVAESRSEPQPHMEEEVRTFPQGTYASMKPPRETFVAGTPEEFEDEGDTTLSGRGEAVPASQRARTQRKKRRFSSSRPMPRYVYARRAQGRVAQAQQAQATKPSRQPKPQEPEEPEEPVMARIAKLRARQAARSRSNSELQPDGK